MGREERREEERRRSGVGLWAVCVLGTQSGYGQGQAQNWNQIQRPKPCVCSGWNETSLSSV